MVAGAGEAEVLEDQRRGHHLFKLRCLVSHLCGTAKEMLLEKILGSCVSLVFPHLWVCSSVVSGGLGPLLAGTRKKSWMKTDSWTPQASLHLSPHKTLDTEDFRQ